VLHELARGFSLECSRKLPIVHRAAIRIKGYTWSTKPSPSGSILEGLSSSSKTRRRHPSCATRC
jgi:hypothetical protein